MKQEIIEGRCPTCRFGIPENGECELDWENPDGSENKLFCADNPKPCKHFRRK